MTGALKVPGMLNETGVRYLVIPTELAGHVLGCGEGEGPRVAVLDEMSEKIGEISVEQALRSL